MTVLHVPPDLSLSRLLLMLHFKSSMTTSVRIEHCEFSVALCIHVHVPVVVLCMHVPINAYAYILVIRFELPCM